MNIFITGIGSGLGEALAKEYLDSGHNVYAISRHIPNSLLQYDNLHFAKLNLFAHEKIERALRFLDGVEIDIAILNAGILGNLRDMSDVSLHEIDSVMNLNVWANKVILDYLKYSSVKQIVAISSGASVSGARGWNAYALSKATLNMLIRLYSQEMPHTHLCALAPGLIDTPMMRYILNSPEAKQYSVVKRLKNSLKMPPSEAARLLIDSFVKLLEFPSGEYIDIRNLVDE